MGNNNEMKTGGFNYMKMLILFGMIPLLIAIIVETIVSATRTTSSMEDAIFQKLESTNKAINQYLNDVIANAGYEIYLAEDADHNFVDSFTASSSVIPVRLPT